MRPCVIIIRPLEKDPPLSLTLTLSSLPLRPALIQLGGADIDLGPLPLPPPDATEFVLDFTDSLVFPWIDTIVSYTVMLPRSQPGFSAPLVQHAAEMPFGSGEAVAVVRLSSASDATVTVSVAQCV